MEVLTLFSPGISDSRFCIRCSTIGVKNLTISFDDLCPPVANLAAMLLELTSFQLCFDTINVLCKDFRH